MFEWESYYVANVFAEGVSLDGSSEWMLELTLSYNGERFTWTSTQTMQVDVTTKAIPIINLIQYIPQWGPQEVYHEKEK
jgi:hypothetical protein